MSQDQKTLHFTIIYQGEEYPVQTDYNEYASLMTLISTRFGMINFGICNGMGSCGTCMVTIREKFSSHQRDSLSCCIYLDDEIANCRITVHESEY